MEAAVGIVPGKTEKRINDLCSVCAERTRRRVVSDNRLSKPLGINRVSKNQNELHPFGTISRAACVHRINRGSAAGTNVEKKYQLWNCSLACSFVRSFTLEKPRAVAEHAGSGVSE